MSLDVLLEAASSGVLQAVTCSRPLYEMLAEAVNGGRAPLDWVLCSYAISGLGVSGVGMFLSFTVAVGLKNWTEGFTVPVIWIVLSGGALVGFVPAPLWTKVAGVVTAAVAFLFIGLWYYLGR